ncbi:MAG: hypothetical protein LBG80_00770, partial [Bacteroidales bacterium]|nr:hypothetical protein [Bacteroidales bacterium]
PYFYYLFKLFSYSYGFIGIAFFYRCKGSKKTITNFKIYKHVEKKHIKKTEDMNNLVFYCSHTWKSKNFHVILPQNYL